MAMATRRRSKAMATEPPMMADMIMGGAEVELGWGVVGVVVSVEGIACTSGVVVTVKGIPVVYSCLVVSTGGMILGGIVVGCADIVRLQHSEVPVGKYAHTT